MAANALPISFFLFILIAVLSSGSLTIVSSTFSIKEATISDLQRAFNQSQLNSSQLVDFYLGEIRRLNPELRGVIEVNPDALQLAETADQERKAGAPRSKLPLHGIPILLKDNIATKDKMNTTSGSFALLGSVVPRPAFVVTKLIESGAIILGKASLTEWAGFRGTPDGWCARSGQGRNPYNLSASTCGSSSGSAISVAANMAAVSLGTETSASILCPSGANSVVGFKPTVGLTSRNGVIPISHREDTVGPICRTVADAVYVLDAIVGPDQNDTATIEASKYIPNGGYKQYLKRDGLQGKKIGVVRYPYSNPVDSNVTNITFAQHIETIRQQGAVLVDNLTIANIGTILDPFKSGQLLVLAADFRVDLNAYLEGLIASPVRSLADVIAFNKNHSEVEEIGEFGQELLEKAEGTKNLTNEELREALSNLTKLSTDGFEKLMKDNNLDAVVTPGDDFATVLAIGGFPGISVPAGYDTKDYPFGIYFGGLKGSEPKLIEIAYGFEQATKIRKPPSFKQ